MDKYTIKITEKTTYKNLILGFDQAFNLLKTNIALDAQLKSRIESFLKENSYNKDKKVLQMSLYDDNIHNIYLVNVDEPTSAVLTETFASLGQTLRTSDIANIAIFAWDESIKNDRLMASVEGLLLGSYIFKGYKKAKKYEVDFTGLDLVVDQASQSSELSSRLEEVEAIVAGTFLTRDLVNEPANIINPTAMEKIANDLAKSGEWSLKVLHQDEIIKKGMHLLNSVGKGSVEAPRLLHFSYKAKGANKTIALVGKGVTYDTGGYSLKPQPNMYGMKSDMGGAGTCFGLVKIISKLGLKVNVDIYTPLVENMVSDRSTKPGDVFIAYNGRSVEVENTDAEGRLILADALSYAAEQKPDCMLDMATLTGAIVVGLGEGIFGAFTNDDQLFSSIEAASKNTGEKVWRLPLEESYKKLLKSDVADCKNVGSRAGGSITAALFLSEFVADVPWCHLDIAGVAFSDSHQPLLPKGATGNPVRTVFHWLKNQ